MGLRIFSGFSRMVEIGVWHAVARGPMESTRGARIESCNRKSRVPPRATWPPTWIAPPAEPDLRAQIRTPTGWSTWTEHRDGQPWSVTQAAGEFVVPWRDADDQHDEPQPGVCRCGAAVHRDVPIHEGRSLRRDCANCGRFVCFPLWHGVSAA